jgi:chromosome segregation ATPase
MHSRQWTWVLMMVSIAVPSFAQVQRSGGGGEAQKLMQQYQQVAGEKTALQSQLAQAKKDLDAARTELAAVKKERDIAKAKAAHPGVSPAALAQATSGKAAAEHSLEQYKQRMNDLIGKFRETATNLKDIEADRTQLRKDLAERNTAYDKCAEDNAQLVQINNEVLDRYAHVGLFTKVSAAEPFTQITRNRMDNLVVEYRERAEQLRVKKTDATPAAAPAAAPSPASPPPDR